MKIGLCGSSGMAHTHVSTGMGPAVHSTSMYGWPCTSRTTCVAQELNSWKTSVTTLPFTKEIFGVILGPGKKTYACSPSVCMRSDKLCGTHRA